MKLRTFWIFAMVAIVLFLSSCIVTSYDYNVEISCDEFSSHNHMSGDFDVEVGDKIRIELCSNPTTGFQWAHEMTMDNVVKEEDHDFEAPEAAIPGATGKEIWTFEAVDTGTTEVQLEYSQPWEGGLKSEWTYTMRVTVE
jgi:inhibitor of cysteine peptidase